MISPSGWLDWTVRQHGIPDKVYSQKNAGLGLVNHSIEGTVAGAMSRFMSTEKNPDGSYTAYAAASVMFVNPKVGVLIQMYPVTASTWTSGNSKANTELWAIENEGVAGEPLNDNQVDNLLRLIGEFESKTGVKITRDSGPNTPTLWEHREVWNWATPNAGPTACPSGRIQPLYDALAAGEDDMALQEQLDQLNAFLVKRERIRELASATGDTGDAKVLQAYDILKGAGLVP